MKQKVKKILEAAARAPSGDNAQPWEIKVSKNFTQVDLYNLPEKDNSLYNYGQAASYIAHGAFLENLLIVARHLGCDADYQLFPDSQNDNHVASIMLKEGAPEEAPYYEAVFKRNTNRFPYKKTDVSSTMLQALQDSIKNIEGSSACFVNDDEQISKVADIFKINDRIVFENKAIHDFFFDKIRWNKKQIEETRDGMPVDVLGLSFIEKFIFPLLRSWRCVKLANWFGLSKIVELKSWWNCRQASILGVLVINGNDRKALVEGGRAAQRIWLETTRQGLAFQPVFGLPLLIYRLQHKAGAHFLERHEQWIRYSSARLRRLFGVKKTEMVLMGFRIGNAGESNKMAQTLRKKVL